MVASRSGDALRPLGRSRGGPDRWLVLASRPGLAFQSAEGAFTAACRAPGRIAGTGARAPWNRNEPGAGGGNRVELREQTGLLNRLFLTLALLLYSGLAQASVPTAKKALVDQLAEVRAHVVSLESGLIDGLRDEKQSKE